MSKSQLVSTFTSYLDEQLDRYSSLNYPQPPYEVSRQGDIPTTIQINPNLWQLLPEFQRNKIVEGLRGNDIALILKDSLKEDI